MSFFSLVLSWASEEQTVFSLVHGHTEFLLEFLFIGALIFSEERTVILLVHGHTEFLLEFLFIGALIG